MNLLKNVKMVLKKESTSEKKTSLQVGDEVYITAIYVLAGGVLLYQFIDRISAIIMAKCVNKPIKLIETKPVGSKIEFHYRDEQDQLKMKSLTPERLKKEATEVTDSSLQQTKKEGLISKYKIEKVI